MGSIGITLIQHCLSNRGVSGARNPMASLIIVDL